MRHIRMTYEIIDQESAEYGDAAERGWCDERGNHFEEYDDELAIPIVPDMYDIKEGKTAVDLAVEFISDNGYVEPSCYPTWSPGTWYTHYGEMETNGEHENISFHLNGFTEEEEKEIYKQLT